MYVYRCSKLNRSQFENYDPIVGAKFSNANLVRKYENILVKEYFYLRRVCV